MKLPVAAWQQAEGMPHLLDVLDAAGGATRYVGGCVRDTRLGLPVTDVDLATRLEPAAVQERLHAAGIRAVATGLAHGTITAVIRSGPVEVTTLRRDVATNGRHAVIAYTDDWREDAARRDFTINALFAHPDTLEIEDYIGGEADLAARIVRFIGDPLTRIAEDHLRILRFFRFHARFGHGDPHPESLAACSERANDLMALSRERIADELLKILALPDPSPTIRLMVTRGILRPVLPEVEEGGVTRLTALIAREASARIDPHPLRRLAALLPRDPALAASVAARLRLSKKALKRLVSAAEPDLAAPPQLAYRIGREEAIDRLLLSAEPAASVGTLENWQRPQFPLTGGDLVALGLRPGPAVATLLQALEREWAHGGFVESRVALQERAKLLIANSPAHDPSC